MRSALYMMFYPLLWERLVGRQRCGTAGERVAYPLGCPVDDLFFPPRKRSERPKAEEALKRKRGRALSTQCVGQYKRVHVCNEQVLYTSYLIIIRTSHT